MIDNSGIADKIWFSDEAHFYLNSQVNKKNCRYWGTEKPDFYFRKNTAFRKGYGVGRVKCKCYYWSIFLRGQETVNKDRYLNIMKRKFMPALRKKVVNVGDIWFQQDGAAPHTATGVLAWLEETLSQKLHFVEDSH
jgi:hypothetical protein